MSAFGTFLRLAGHVPAALWRPVVEVGAVLVAVRPPRPVRQWQRNAAVVTGTEPGWDDTRRAVRSWARNVLVTAQLHTWSASQRVQRVQVSAEQRQALVDAHARGGAVVALPHMGSWDLAGAWACQLGLPVTTVAEEVPEFDLFVARREALGFRVLGLEDPRGLAKLLADQRSGRMTCLVSDRTFGPGGVEVDWHTADGPRRVRLPGGAAQVALRTGSALFACTTRFQGDGIRLDLVGPLRPDPSDPTGSLVQQLADVFSHQVAAHPTEWHMLVPFFPGELAP